MDCKNIKSVSCKQKIKVGLIGVGKISESYVDALCSNKKFNLIAVCDINSKSLKKFNGVLKYSSYKKMLDDSGIDVAILCLPNSLHHEVVIECIKNNIAVICEKPLALSVSDQINIKKIARMRSVVVYTAFHRRFNENFIQLRKSIDKIGKISYVRASYLENISDHTNGNWYSDLSISGGGCILDNGTNVVACMLDLVDDIKLKNSNVLLYDGVKVEKSAELQFSFSKANNAGVGVISLDWTYCGEKKEIVIVGTKGVLFCDFLNGFSSFKGSLKHEYVAILNDFFDNYISNKDNLDDSIRVAKFIRSAYIRAKRVDD